MLSADRQTRRSTKLGMVNRASDTTITHSRMTRTISRKRTSRWKGIYAMHIFLYACAGWTRIFGLSEAKEVTTSRPLIQNAHRCP